MVSKSKNIIICRLCKKNNLKTIIDFGSIPLGNNLKSNKQSSICLEKYPLSINQCLDCKHYQLSYSVDPKLLYATNYTYLTGVGKSFRNHLEKFTDDVLDFFEHKVKKDKIKVIDIGSNDGTALSCFANLGCEVLGIDPAKIPSDIANKKNINTINDFFSLDLAKKIVKENKSADIVISHNVLAHIEDIHDIFEGIKQILKTNGVFVFEVGYFGDIILKNIFDTIYHEHLDYHSIVPMTKFLLSKGFSIKKIENNTIQGGTLRFYCIKDKFPLIFPSVKKLLDVEEKIFSSNNVDEWIKNIFKNIENIKQNINEALNKDLVVWGYGAPTKAALITNLLGDIRNSIRFIVDDNCLKENKYIPGTQIPIIKKKERPVLQDQLIICFAWNFFDDILAKLKTENIKGTLLNINNGKREKL